MYRTYENALWFGSGGHLQWGPLDARLYLAHFLQEGVKGVELRQWSLSIDWKF